MPTNFPTSVDNFTNPTANDSLNLPSHSTQHANANDAIEAVEDYVLNGAGKSGLVLLKTQTVGTTVSSVTVTSAFNANYDEYKIIYSGGVASAGFVSMYMTIGGINSGYYSSGVYQSAVSATQVTFNAAVSGVWFPGYCGNQYMKFEIDVSNPFKVSPKTGNGRYSTYDNVNSTGGTFYLVTTSTASCTQFALAPASGTLTGGTIYVYGYKAA
jgi:hypothetical protein